MSTASGRIHSTRGTCQVLCGVLDPIACFRRARRGNRGYSHLVDVPGAEAVTVNVTVDVTVDVTIDVTVFAGELVVVVAGVVVSVDLLEVTEVVVLEQAPPILNWLDSE